MVNGQFTLTKYVHVFFVINIFIRLINCITHFFSTSCYLLNFLVGFVGKIKMCVHSKTRSFIGSISISSSSNSMLRASSFVSIHNNWEIGWIRRFFEWSRSRFQGLTFAVIGKRMGIGEYWKPSCHSKKTFGPHFCISSYISQNSWRWNTRKRTTIVYIRSVVIRAMSNDCR